MRALPPPGAHSATIAARAPKSRQFTPGCSRRIATLHPVSSPSAAAYAQACRHSPL